MPAQPRYVEVVDATLRRLVANVREAADEGALAASESAALHAWVRSELLPWAADTMRGLDVQRRRTLAPMFTELALIDAELLGTAGPAAAVLSERLRNTAHRLLLALGLRSAGWDPTPSGG